MSKSERRRQSHCSHSNTPYLTERMPTVSADNVMLGAGHGHSEPMGRNAQTPAWERIPRACGHIPSVACVGPLATPLLGHSHQHIQLWALLVKALPLPQASGGVFLQNSSSTDTFLVIHADLLPPLHYYIILPCAHGVPLVVSASVMLTRQPCPPFIPENQI